jgi:hypothetical protein
MFTHQWRICASQHCVLEVRPMAVARAAADITAPKHRRRRLGTSAMNQHQLIGG